MSVAKLSLARGPAQAVLVLPVDDPLVLNTPVEKPTVNPQLDATITTPVQKQKLSESFQSFWENEDAKGLPAVDRDPPPPELLEKEPPEAPKAEKEEDPKEAPKPAAKEEPEVKPEANAEVKPEVKPEAKKVDFENLELRSDAPEAQKSQFKQLKEITQKFSSEAKAYRSRLTPLLQEFGFDLKDNPEEVDLALQEFTNKIRALKTGAITPEVQSELENLRTLARSVGVLQSQEFTDTYVKPLDDAYTNVIKEMALYFDAEPDKIKEDFLDPLLTKYKPSQLPPEWWDQQIEAMTKCPRSTKLKIEGKIAGVLNLQEKHDLAAKNLAENTQSYADWNKKTMEAGAKEYQGMVADEVSKMAREDPEIAAFMPIPTDGINDPDKLNAIRKSNARYPELENKFRSILTDFSTGPRSSARRAMEFIKVTEGYNALKESAKTKDEETAAVRETLEQELKESKEEIANLRAEVTKKRKLGDIPLKPDSGSTAKSEPQKAPLPKDARKSLTKAFDEWQT